MLVERFQTRLQIPVAFLRADGLDGVAPGGGLAEKVLELRQLGFEVPDLAFDLGSLAVAELSLGLAGPRGMRGSPVGTTGSRRRFRLAAFRSLLLLLN